MSKNNVEILLTVKDDASGKIKALAQQAQQRSRAMAAAESAGAAQSRRTATETAQHRYRLLDREQAAAARSAQSRIRTEAQVGRALQQEAERRTRSEQQAARAGMNAARQSNAYKLLGIRSEQQIRAELARTEAAYRHLARSGTASQRDLQQAARNLRAEQRRLNNELNGGLASGTGGGRLAKAGQIAAGVGMAAVAAGSIVNPKLNRVAALDLAMAKNASLLDGNESRAEKKQIARQQVEDAVSLGIERDEALDMQNTMLARGGLSRDEMAAALKSGARIRVASGFEAEGADIARMSAAVLDFGFNSDNLEDGLGMVFQGGKEGSFEIADFARNAGSLLTVAKNQAGMGGARDLAYINAHLQTATNISGSKDEAANNVEQFYAALNSEVVKTNFQKAGVKNYDDRVLMGQKQGLNIAEIGVGMLYQDVLQNDKKWLDLQESMGNARNDKDKMEIAAKQERYLAGSAAGEVFRDKQARMGLLAILNDIEKFNGLLAKIENADRSAITDDYHEFGSNTLHGKEIRAANAKDKAEETAYRKPAEMRSNVQEWYADFAADNPITAALASGGADLAKIAMAGGIGSLVFGKIGGAAAAGGGATAATGAATRLGAVASASLPLAARAVPFLGGAVGLWHGNKTINAAQGKGLFEGGLSSRAAGYGESAMGGAAVGAVVGSVVPVIGTAVGAAVGGGIGLLSAVIADLWHEPAPSADIQAAVPPPVAPMLESPVLQQSAQQYSDASAVQQQASGLFAENVLLGRQSGESMLQSAVQIQQSANVMQSAAGVMAQGVHVRVSVENGNIMAHVDGQIERAIKRNGG